MICKNCEYDFNGNFCNNCGQSTRTRRIDFQYLLSEIPNSILQVNRGFLFTVLQLFMRPGHSIKAFLEGKRKHYYKPIAFLLVTSSLYVMSYYLMSRNTIVNDVVIGFKSGMQAKNDTSGYEILNWLTKHQTYVTLLFIPLFSFASYLAFKKSKFNYIEHLIMNFYITGQQMIIYMILGLVFLKDNILMGAPVIIGTLFNLWVFLQFFQDKTTLKKILLILLTYILFILEILLVFLIIGILSL